VAISFFSTDEVGETINAPEIWRKIESFASPDAREVIRIGPIRHVGC